MQTQQLWLLGHERHALKHVRVCRWLSLCLIPPPRPLLLDALLHALLKRVDLFGLSCSEVGQTQPHGLLSVKENKGLALR